MRSLFSQLNKFTIALNYFKIPAICATKILNLLSKKKPITVMSANFKTSGNVPISMDSFKSFYNILAVAFALILSTFEEYCLWLMI